MEPSIVVKAGAPSESVDGTANVTHVVCSVCEQELPISEAVIPEVTDYVIYLCGLDCYARWTSGGGSEP